MRHFAATNKKDRCKKERVEKLFGYVSGSWSFG